MKAMILAAGRGERMRPLTDNLPKPLLQVAGKSLIEYHIEALVKAGTTQLVVNHAWLGEKIEAHLGDGSQYGAAIIYSREDQALETAGGIIKALDILGDEPFIVVNGDIYTDYSFDSLKYFVTSFKNNQQTAHLILVPNPPHHIKGDFYCQDNILSEQKNNLKGQRFTFSGIACYKPEFFKNLPAGKQALGPLLRSAMSIQMVSGEIYEGLWCDIGTPQRLEEINDRYGKKGGGVK
ncbi:MAG: nucleotidyltransferase family protein [gamma proteobacterium symbiont of Taylorina sp.]|nr:nucleotidyltransferase family protein [gamma proteobacterium symbiont of Taylorina sp.]